MSKSLLSLLLTIAALLSLASCASIRDRSAFEFEQMDKYLTSDDPGTCGRYHYNYERKAPRLYADGQIDSLLDVIDYIKTECGPASSLEVTRFLVLSERGEFGDSLIGPSTVPQMLVFRNRHEVSSYFRNWQYMYWTNEPVDNTQDNFARFEKQLAERVADDSNRTETERVMARFYAGEYDSAFSEIQAGSMRGTILRRSYDNFVADIKRQYPIRGNVAFLVGSWQPQGDLKFLGKHPEIGFQAGAEQRWWRVDGVVDVRFRNSPNEYLVDSLGQIVSTKKFYSVLLGCDAGVKLVDNMAFSTDLFVGLGYDYMGSVTQEGDPNTTKFHSSIGASVGVRQRFFLNPRSGWYVGGILRYGPVDYSNPGGTDLSGNVATISFITGWSFHETVNQILGKLNYKGSRRP